MKLTVLESSGYISNERFIPAQPRQCELAGLFLRVIGSASRPRRDQTGECTPRLNLAR
jgi:hypothetical protein